MKKTTLLLLTLFSLTSAFAQVGFKKKKADIEKFKDTRLVIVLAQDSAYNASITEAMEKYWTFSGGFIFDYDTAMKKYSKPEFSYLYFSKSRGTKIKAKLGTSEVDFNGLVVTMGSKFKKKAAEDELVAGAHCGNIIDTLDWRPEITLAVQMLNNYFNTAILAENDKGITTKYIADNAPTDKRLLDEVLMFPLRSLDLKGKEDAAELWGGDVEDVLMTEAYKAIMKPADKLLFFYSKAEKTCSKIVTSTTGELVFYKEDSADKCKLNAKDLKELGAKRNQ